MASKLGPGELNKKYAQNLDACVCDCEVFDCKDVKHCPVNLKILQLYICVAV